jgi:hypothetical protein
LASALLLSAGGALAADGDLPSAETILDRFIEVTGGRAAYEKRHSECMVQDIEIVNTPIKGTVTTYREGPNKAYTEVDLPMIGKFRQGSNGTIAWSISPMNGAKLLEGEELEHALIGGRFNGDLYWREYYKRVETVGVEDLDGKPAYVVKRTYGVGRPITDYYDAATNLLLKGITKQQTTNGEVRSEILVSDYRKEGGVLIPHKIVTKSPGEERIITVRTVTINQEAPPGTFDIPDEVKALLKKP